MTVDMRIKWISEVIIYPRTLKNIILVILTCRKAHKLDVMRL